MISLATILIILSKNVKCSLVSTVRMFLLCGKKTEYIYISDCDTVWNGEKKAIWCVALGIFHKIFSF